MNCSPSHDVVTTVKFSIIRLVVDPERFESDEPESMAARGVRDRFSPTRRGLACHYERRAA
jgi:hypothetical protein